MKRVIIVSIIALYIIIASVGCIPCAVASHELLSCVGIESQIVSVGCINTDSYAHCAISINDKVYEPRYIGMYHQVNIDYTIIDSYNSTETFLKDYSILPTKELITKMIMEKIKYE